MLHVNKVVRRDDAAGPSLKLFDGRPVGSDLPAPNAADRHAIALNGLSNLFVGEVVGGHVIGEVCHNGQCTLGVQ